MERLNKDENEDVEAREKDQEVEKKPGVGKILKNVFKDVTDFRLLIENRSFLFIALANFFVFFVYFIPFIFIPIRAKQLEIKEYAWIISIIGKNC
jgi:hypothetical protein